jgi:hypothetical protein
MKNESKKAKPVVEKVSKPVLKRGEKSSERGRGNRLNKTTLYQTPTRIIALKS